MLSHIEALYRAGFVSQADRELSVLIERERCVVIPLRAKYRQSR